MNTFENLCLIPAKASSTRLPKKNLLPLRGKPMLTYAVEAARASGLFGEHIWVSTESEEVAEAAQKAGARVHLRPEYLAHDPYGICDVALEFLEKHSKYQKFSTLFLLQANSPFLLPQDIKAACKIFEEKRAEVLMSVSPFEHPAYRAVVDKNGFLSPLFPEMISRKTQEFPETYRINGAIVIVKISKFLRVRTYFFYPIALYKMPRERGIDIDTWFDYIVAKSIMENEELRSILKNYG